MGNLVSVIMPTYKRSFEMVNRAIASVLNQTHQELELIIVNDNPKNDRYKKEINDKITNIKDSRIKLIQHEDNLGACVARNTGIKNSTGKYLGFLDDDDEWISNKLELQLERFNNKNVGLVYCDSYSVTIKNNKQIEKSLRSFRISGRVYEELIKKNFVGSTSFVLLKKEAIESCGLFNNKMKSAQDYELWLRVSKKYIIDFVGVPLVNYYLHEGERISSNVNNKIQGLEKIIQYNIQYLKKHPKIYSERKLAIIPYYYASGGYTLSLKKCWEAFKIAPLNMKLYKNIIRVTLLKLGYKKKK